MFIKNVITSYRNSSKSFNHCSWIVLLFYLWTRSYEYLFQQIKHLMNMLNLTTSQSNFTGCRLAVLSRWYVTLTFHVYYCNELFTELKCIGSYQYSYNFNSYRTFRNYLYCPSDCLITLRSLLCFIRNYNTELIQHLPKTFYVLVIRNWNKYSFAIFISKSRNII